MKNNKKLDKFLFYFQGHGVVFAVLEYVSTIGAADNPLGTGWHVSNIVAFMFLYIFLGHFFGHTFIHTATFWTFLVEFLCFHQDSSKSNSKI
jgi:hypothetical protein